MMWLLAALLGTPPQLDIERYLTPPPPTVECTTDMTRYEPYAIPVTGSRIIEFTDAGIRRQWNVEPGYVVSECEFVEIINVRAEHRRLREENDVVGRLRRRERELWELSEQQYRRTILAMEEELTSWWRNNAFVLGLATGVVGTGVVVFALK